jgi:hypothetical protein
MATDRDEQQQQKQELEEIRRSFAEMGARMGSLFEPAEPDGVHQPMLPAPPPATPATPAPPAPARPSWWAVVALALVFLVGGLFGYVIPRGGSGNAASPPPTPSSVATTALPTTTAEVRTRTSVPEVCVEMAELADEIIARLNRNIRDNRLGTALVEYSAANQACRREASP